MDQTSAGTESATSAPATISSEKNKNSHFTNCITEIKHILKQFIFTHKKKIKSQFGVKDANLQAKQQQNESQVKRGPLFM